MKRRAIFRAFPCSIAVLSMVSFVGLTGCTGFYETATSVSETSNSGGAITGSNFGGHAPIVGAHIYLLQAGTTGYGGLATSLLSSGTAQYPIAANVNDPNVPTTQNVTGQPSAWNYVTSDKSGYFSVSGDYSCTPGLPVYLYGYGGTPAIAPNSPVTAFSTAGTTVTLTTNALVSVGQSVQFAGFNGTGVAGLDSGTYTVLSTPTLNTFTVTLASASGSGTLSAAIVKPVLNNNPNIVQLALLGNCPTTGSPNFASTIQFVYMNEVSTVAAAYALSGFFTNSSTALTATDAVHLSIPLEGGQAGVTAGTSPAWLGLENAAANAAVLYNIQGAVVGTSGDGEAHIANSSLTSTPNNGVVPQALINSLANALAYCVDSGSTSGSTSTQCTNLFGYLGSTMGAGGTPGGTAPTDTATAAIDMAHNPGNKNASAILGLAGAIVPFTPTVVAANSTDLVIGITWAVPAAEQAGKFVGTEPVGSTAIDTAGNVWAGSYGITALGTEATNGYLLKYDHLGNQLVATSVPYNPEVIALDNSGNLYSLPNGLAGGTVGMYLYSDATGAYENQFTAQTFSNPENFVIDGNDSAYVTTYSGGLAYKISSTGALQCTYNQNTASSWAAGMDKSQNFWLGAYGKPAQEWLYGNCNKFGGNAATYSGPTNVASPQSLVFDQSGNAWITDRTTGNGGTTPVSKLVVGGTQTAFNGGGFNKQGATALAVDGDNRILAGAWTSPFLFTVLDNNGNYLTSSNGLTGNYTITGGATVTTTEGFWFFGLDGSGNLWSNGPTQLHEYIGVAAPVLTPLATALKAGTIAAKP